MKLSSQDRRGPSPAETHAARRAAFVFALALGARLLVAARTAVIYPDGAVYLSMARDFGAGEGQAGLRRIFHPAYPALVALLEAALPLSLEACGILIAALVSAAAALVIAAAADAAARAASGRPGGGFIIGGALAALHAALAVPGGQVLAYPVSQLGFALAALALTRLAVDPERRDAVRAGALAGAGTALAYLARPDGLLWMAGAGIALFSLTLRRPRRGLLACLAFLLAAAVLAGPYVAWVSAESGRLRPTLKKDPEAWLRALPGDAPAPEETGAELRELILNHDRGLHSRPPPPPSIPGAVSWAARQSAKAIELAMLCFAAAGIGLLLRARAWPLLLALALPALALFSGHVFLFWKAGYLSTRHASYQAIPAIILASVTIACLARRSPWLAPGPASMVLALALSAPSLARLPRARLAHKREARELGAAIAAAAGSGPRPLVIGEEVRQVAFYAGAEFLPLPLGPEGARRLDAARREGRAFLAVYIRTRRPGLDPRIERVIARWGGALIAERRGRRRDLRYHWRAYRLAAPSAAPK